MTFADTREFLIKVLVKKGMYAFEAEVVADRMLDADALGRHADGCVSLSRYVNAMDVGDIDPRALALPEKDLPAVSFTDANEGMGHVAASKGMEAAIEKAKVCGIGLSVIANSQSLGCPLIYAHMAAEAGMIGLCLSSTADKNASPDDRRRDLFLGSQPLAYAVPDAGQPLGFDFSFRDDDAQSVTLPIALRGPVGFLHAILTCGLTGERMPSQQKKSTPVERTEHFLMALDPAAFAGPEKMQQEVTELTAYLRNEGFSLIKPKDESRFELPEATVDSLRALAEKEKIAWPFE
ncbi:MAG: hypothetical protein CMJ47_08520 [Planctomyces sp.]|nr:hypothetical protein [Planctomyces sp.]